MSTGAGPILTALRDHLAGISGYRVEESLPSPPEVRDRTIYVEPAQLRRVDGEGAARTWVLMAMIVIGARLTAGGASTRWAGVLLAIEDVLTRLAPDGLMAALRAAGAVATERGDVDVWSFPQRASGGAAGAITSVTVSFERL